MKLRATLAAAALLFTLGACSSDNQTAVEVCVDPTTNMRVDDSMCRTSYPMNPFVYWYIMPGYVIPAYGWPVTYGYPTPRGYRTMSAPSAGGVVPKRSTFSRSRTPQTVQPTSAATQPPPPKKQTWGNKPAQPANKPQTQTQPRTQPKPASQPQWQQYKPPPASRPQPPSYPKYR